MKTIVPIPIEHLAKNVGLARRTVLKAIQDGYLNAVRFAQNEQGETILAPYASEYAEGTTVYIMPEEAKKYIEYLKQKREKISRDRMSQNINVSSELYSKILEAAEEVRSEDGKVNRIDVLAKLGNKNNMSLYKKIKFVLDQYLEEFPPKYPNQLGNKRRQ